MSSLIDRVEELTAEAEEKGVADQVHHPDIEAAILAYADLLGYKIPEALDPDIPLTRS